jgi:TorA maturation chaperone TorD
VTSLPTDRGAELASAARLPGRWWSRPLADELTTWERTWPDAGDAAAGIELEPGLVWELADAVQAAEAEALLDEYERLFVGPGRAPCQPYESLWRDDAPRREQGMLMGRAAGDVAALYAELDLVVSPRAHELPDHVAVEWEAVAYAIETGADDVVRRLLAEHLAVWLPPFCAAVQAEAREPFYVALAALTPAWVSSLLAALPER